MQSEIARVETLLEALPYIRRFSGKTIVIKYGGAAMDKADLRDQFARDITLLQYVGIRPVIVHGGGPMINSLLDRLGVKSEFVDGHRVTDEESMQIVEMVLAGQVNKSIVSLINFSGGKAVGLTGRDGNLARARLHGFQKKAADGSLVEVSLGRVGHVTPEDIDCSIIETLEYDGFIPVIAPVAFDDQGKPLNINADTMAGAIASALKAEKLILLTDTPGVMKDGKTLTGLNSAKVQALMQEGIIQGGMIPKVKCCLAALEHGVVRTHIIDGRVPHALLLEILTDTGVGTLITNEEL